MDVDLCTPLFSFGGSLSRKGKNVFLIFFVDSTPLSHFRGFTVAEFTRSRCLALVEHFSNAGNNEAWQHRGIFSKKKCGSVFSLELGAAKAQLTRKEERYGITETIAKRL